MPELPATLGACADRLHEIKALRAELKKQDDVLDRERKDIEAKLIDELPKSDAQGVVGHVARAKIITQTTATVKDWPKLWAHISRTKSWDLLQKRIASSAVKERWEAGKQVPGVDTFKVVKVSLTKA